MAEASVPRDRLLPPRHAFPAVDRARVEAAFEKAHAISEDVYRGKGLWEPGAVRKTSRRVLGYLGAWAATGESAYRQRAEEGLEALLDEQKPAGNYVWYHHSRDGLDRCDHSLYDTGIAGRAFVLGGRMLQQERYLTASLRAAEWAMAQSLSPNNNYNCFAVWHLAAHYRATGEAALLESAIVKARDGGLPGQLPSGGWPGHNSWIWYHGILVRGLAELDTVLPPDHPDAPAIRAGLIAALNRLIAEQTPEGQVPPNPGETRDGHRNAFSLSALLIAEARRRELGPVIDGLMHYRLNDFARVQRPGRVDWPEEVAASETIVWAPSLDAAAPSDAWGVLPAGAFPCWVPGHDPSPGEVAYALAAGPEPSVRVRFLRGPGNAGFGFRLPEGAVEPGRPYRLSARMRVDESLAGAGTISNLRLGAYGGAERGTWDPTTNCAYRVETPEIGGYRAIDLDFRAGDCNLVYFFVQSQPVRPEAPVEFQVAEIQLRPLLREPDPDPVVPRETDCDIMAFGFYLGYRHALQSMI